MAEPFLAEIRTFSFNFAPKGWAMCNGQLLPINQNQALFSLLGTTYGGDGRVNFALPDFRGRTPVHVGDGFVLGQRGGEQAHTVTLAEMPSHAHALQASSAGADRAAPGGNVLASASGLYGPAVALTPLEPRSTTSAGGSQAHLNMQPYLTLTVCIALQGIFPSPN
jgi:microcystin-dependent protein